MRTLTIRFQAISNDRLIRYPTQETVPCHEAKRLAYKSVPLKERRTDSMPVKTRRAEQLQKDLEIKIADAMSRCDPFKHERNSACDVLWDEIEELSNTLYDIKHPTDR